MFDTFVIVDWSAATMPRTGRDSIWICRHGPRWRDAAKPADPARREGAAGRNARRGGGTRRAGAGRLRFPVRLSRRVSPLGSGSPVPPWRAVWDEIAGLIEDGEDNRNNRFAVAAELNRRVSGGRFPFWGCPAGFRARLPRPQAPSRPRQREGLPRSG